MPFIIIGGLIAIFVIWGIGVQRRLVAMDENVNNAMSQIGVQLSSRFDALTALLDLAKGYAAHESQTLIETGPHLHGSGAVSRAEGQREL